MIGGTEPKPFREVVVYSRTLQTTTPLYGDLNRIGTVKAEPAAPARNLRKARGRVEARWPLHPASAQLPAETITVAERVAMPKRLAAVAGQLATVAGRLATIAGGHRAIVQAGDLGIVRSDLSRVGSGDNWRQSSSATRSGFGLAVAARALGVLEGGGSRSDRANATTAFQRPMYPDLQGLPQEGLQVGPIAALAAAASRTRAGPFAPYQMTGATVREPGAELPSAWSGRTAPTGHPSQWEIPSDSRSSGRGRSPVATADPRAEAGPDRFLDLLAERASRPPRGITGVDPRLGPTYPGGFGRQW